MFVSTQTRKISPQVDISKYLLKIDSPKPVKNPQINEENCSLIGECSGLYMQVFSIGFCKDTKKLYMLIYNRVDAA